jgi:hypothetical protein
VQYDGKPVIQVRLTEQSGAELLFESSESYQDAIDSLIAYLLDCKKYGSIRPKTITFEQIP